MILNIARHPKPDLQRLVKILLMNLLFSYYQLVRAEENVLANMTIALYGP